MRELAERKETILKSIEAQGKLTDELAEAIRGADNPKRLEDLYLPFKPKKRTKASDAREKGLEPLALRIWNRDETLTDLHAAAEEFLNPEKGVETDRAGPRRGRPHPGRVDQRAGQRPRRRSAASSGGPARSSPPRPTTCPRPRASNTATTSTTPSRSATSRRTACWPSTAATRKAR